MKEIRCIVMNDQGGMVMKEIKGALVMKEIKGAW